MKKLMMGLIFFCLSAAVWADVPKTINYQGRLTDLSGNILQDGTYSIAVRLYDSVTALEGASLWADVYSVQTKSGYFSVALGSTTAFPAAVDFNKPYWLGIKVGSDSEMTPRQPLNSVPYALAVPDKSITATWSTTSGIQNYSAANQTITLATLTITPTKDGVLCIWGRGHTYAGASFFIESTLQVNSSIVDTVDAGSTSAGERIPYSLQATLPVVANTSYTITLVGMTSASDFVGSTLRHSLIATVYYK